MSKPANPVTLPLADYSPKHFLLAVVGGSSRPDPTWWDHASSPSRATPTDRPGVRHRRWASATSAVSTVVRRSGRDMSTEATQAVGES